MGKIKLYMVSMCTVDSDTDTFIDNLCTIVSSKKEITEYVKNKIIEDHKEHYNSWIKLHDKKDNSATPIIILISVGGVVIIGVVAAVIVMKKKSGNKTEGSEAANEGDVEEWKE